MTPAGAGQAIEQTLMAKQYMLHPQVSVSVEVFATLDVSVMGQVKDPGTYDLQTPTPILKILSMAGGLTDLADRSITIERHSDPSKTITYYVSNRSDEAMTNQVNVYPGDLVLVPKVGVVYVLGDVGHPGGYPMTTNDSKMTAMQAIALAGTLNHTAALSKAKLIRKTSAGLQDIPLQVSEIQRGRQPDVTLQPDDVLYIPFSWMKNAILASSSIMSTAAQSIIYAHP
jgi:polysaccharide export outer membrane protein